MSRRRLIYDFDVPDNAQEIDTYRGHKIYRDMKEFFTLFDESDDAWIGASVAEAKDFLDCCYSDDVWWHYREINMLPDDVIRELRKLNNPSAHWAAQFIETIMADVAEIEDGESK